MTSKNAWILEQFFAATCFFIVALAVYDYRTGISHCSGTGRAHPERNQEETEAGTI